MSDCHAYKNVPIHFGVSGQLTCDLPGAHQGALHYDRHLSVWWMPLLPGEHAEDVPAGVRMNEDMPASLAGQWMRGNR